MSDPNTKSKDNLYLEVSVSATSRQRVCCLLREGTSGKTTAPALKFLIPPSVLETAYFWKKNTIVDDYSQGVILGFWTH